MSPAQVTPLILTYNEEANIARSLAGLAWAERIVVVDSYSTDGTLDLLRAHPAVDLRQRPFDCFRNQWDFGLSLVDTEWVLTLDADYICHPQLADELEALPDDPPESGFETRFRYLIGGRPLRGSVYPPRTVLFRKDRAAHVQDGHTQRIVIDGAVGRLRSVIDHDDRKPLGHWLSAQQRYASEEAAKLLRTPKDRLSFIDRLRLRRWLAPLVMPAYCLVAKGGILDGRAGIEYAMQRTYAEILLALRLGDPAMKHVPGRAELPAAPESAVEIDASVLAATQ